MNKQQVYVALIMWNGELDDVITFTSSEEANQYVRIRCNDSKYKGSTVWISHVFDSAAEYIRESE